MSNCPDWERRLRRDFYESAKLYDSEGERLLILDRTHFFALTLRDKATWHGVREAGLGMPRVRDRRWDCSTLIGLAPTAFAALGNGAFRCDLKPRYCD